MSYRTKCLVIFLPNFTKYGKIYMPNMVNITYQIYQKPKSSVVWVGGDLTSLFFSKVVKY